MSIKDSKNGEELVNGEEQTVDEGLSGGEEQNTGERLSGSEERNAGEDRNGSGQKAGSKNRVISEEHNSKKKAKPKKKSLVKKIIKIVVIVLIVAIAALVGIYIFKSKKLEEAAMFAGNAVVINTVERMDISNSVAVTGSIVSNETRNISTLVSKTKVKEVSVKVGDYVKKGDPICIFERDSIVDRIDRLQKQMYVTASKARINEMEAGTKLAWTLQDAYETAIDNEENVQAAIRNYNAAERNLGEAKKRLEEAQEDYDDDDTDENERALRQAELNVASAKDSVASAIDSYNDAVRAQVDDYENSSRTVSQNQETIITTNLDNTTTNDSSETELEDLMKQLDSCEVVAPIDGVITSVSVQEGDEYDEKSTICVIQDDSVYKVKGTVDQYDISSIQKGMQAVVKTDTTGDEQMAGTVTFVAPTPQSAASGTSGSGSSTATASTAGTNYEIEITLSSKDPRLRLGMTAESSILTNKRTGVLALPYDCVEKGDDGNSYVYVVEDGGAPEGGEFGDNAGPQADMGKTSGIRHFFSVIFGSGESEAFTPTVIPTKQVQVETGLETDYYVEIISDEIKEGDQVKVPDGTEGMGDFDFGGGFGMGGPPPRGRR